MAFSRSGILAGGNFIVDYVKVIDHFPAQDTLVNILSESQSNGGGPYNVLKDLAAMQAPFPLAAAGMLGDDENGRWIRQDCETQRINVEQLHVTRGCSTSYTDAMSVKGTGRRTFFHQRGANALLDVQHFDFSRSKAKLFHLGYLMLLDRLDAFEKTGGQDRTRSSLVLENAKKAGMITSVDVVSTDNPRFREITLSALPYADHLLINEIEAGKALGRPLHTDDIPSLVDAVEELLSLGVQRSVVLHFTEGVVAVERGKSAVSQGSLVLPPGFSQGATGAGDAFAAGYLYGVHEGWAMTQRLDLAICAAATCLTHPSPSAGMRSAAECLALGRDYPHRHALNQKTLSHAEAIK